MTKDKTRKNDDPLDIAKKALNAAKQVTPSGSPVAHGMAGKAAAAGAGHAGLGVGLAAQHGAITAGAAGGTYMTGKGLGMGMAAGIAGWFPVLMAACVGTTTYFLLRGLQERHRRRK
ncbi:hypothetical protein JCM17960_18120 [Magnetospira thiophila]